MIDALVQFLNSVYRALFESPKQKALRILNMTSCFFMNDFLAKRFLDRYHKEVAFDLDMFRAYLNTGLNSEGLDRYQVFDTYLSFPHKRENLLKIALRDLNGLNKEDILLYHGVPHTVTQTKSGNITFKYRGQRGDTYKFNSAGDLVDWTIRT